MWVTKADNRACDAGALPRSETPFSSQKQCHISSPVPYVARVSSSHACTMVSFTRFCSFVLATTLSGEAGCVLAGVHILSRSLARQCGRKMEGIGVRFCGYGAGLLVATLEVDGMSRSRGLVPMVFRRLMGLDPLFTRFSPGSLLRVKPLIAASLVRLLRVCVAEERLELRRYCESRE